MLEAVQASVVRAEWQPVVFADRPRRAGLLELVAAGLPATPVRIHVHRNQPFEFVASCAEAFLRYAGWDPIFTYSDYDDSLGFHTWEAADVEFLWLDLTRYRQSKEDVAAWLGQRIQRLREMTSAPILIAGNADLPLPSLRGVRVCPQATAQTTMDISGPACVETARQFAFLWLPPVLRPRYKAVVVDLDHTLYHGVLGEDGLWGIELTPEHADLQQVLVGLQESGVLLAVVSKNDPADVEMLFEERSDFPLTPQNISAWSVGWLPKSRAIREVADKLRIGLDAILFLDDNAGELAEVASELPELSLLHAADALETTRALKLYPGLNGYAIGAEDRLRAFDLAVAPQRAGSSQAYLASLQIELSFSMDPAGECARLHELSVKTNQFNTGFLRLTEAEVARRIAEPEYRTVAVSLRDRLSDSGTIGAIFTRCTGETIFVEEVSISCRALGRGIEDVMITEALSGIARADGRVRDVEFRFVTGPRNAPARAWLESYKAGSKPETLPVSFLWKKP
jgi:FkbH-like protein